MIMIDVFWGCLIGGAVFAVLTLFLGDMIGHGHDIGHGGEHPGFNFLKPAVIVSAIAAFGGAGLMLVAWTRLGPAPVVVLAILSAIVVAIGVYFFFIKPVMRSENSLAFSIMDLKGKLAQVTTTIPIKGHGEVMVRIGAGVTNQIAASADDVEIRSGATVVVVEIDQNTLYVSAVDPL